MKLILLWTMFLLMEWKPICGAKERIFCVSKHRFQNSRRCPIWVTWSSILNTKKYFNSNTKLLFLPLVFNLDKVILLRSIENLTLTGMESSTFIINCTTTKHNTSFIINHAAFIQISNVKFRNCGANIIPYTINNSFSEAHAAILLSDTLSVTISNVSFENSYGHAVIGINPLGYSVFENIEIFHLNNANGRANDTTNAFIGGFVLAFYDTRSGKDFTNILAIENCSIFSVQQEKVFTLFHVSRSVLKSSAISLLFQQNAYAMNINICHFNITNITSRNGPPVLIQFNSKSVENSVTISHSSFTRNKVENHPIIKMLTFHGTNDVISQSSVYFFKLQYCEISFNTAQFIGYIDHSIENLQLNSLLELNSTNFTYNVVTEAFWKVNYDTNNATVLANVSLINSTFLSNSGFSIQLCSAGNLTLIKDNVFFNNSVNPAGIKLFEFNDTIPMFEGYNYFTFNTADIILSLNNYIFIKEFTIINISYNMALDDTDCTSCHKETKALIYFEKGNSIQPCLFQFLSTKNVDEDFQNNDERDFFTVILKNNTNYNSITFGTQLNSCYWLKQSSLKTLTPASVYEKVLQYDTSDISAIGRQVGTLCYCKNETYVDCLRDHNFGSIYPGQIIPISLIRMPPNNVVNTAIYSSSFPYSHNAYVMPYEQCPLELEWLQLLHTNCTPISYKVYSRNSLETSKKCYVSFRATYPDDSFYIYYVDFKECPLGFAIHNGSCDCDKNLKTAFPDLRCNIQTQTFTHPGKSWIGLSNEKKHIKYTKHCAPTVCKEYPTDVKLDTPDTQCNFNRSGLACGYCPPELGAVFGSMTCKRCSNYWLLLLPVYMLAGMLLILFLFTLNLTIVDGKINGFILYVNAMVVHIYRIFPTSKLAVIISLVNLDLGIETCFYNGMTEYEKTWLQFAFPSYLLLIVAVLAYTSRYSSLVEKLTRRRVIPVITTIFLLTYSKLLMVTSKVFFSYMTIYTLPDHQSIVVWTWDSSVPLFGVKYTVLFIASLLLLVLVLLPLNLFLLFTKVVLRFKCFAKYLKPYLDAFQAPFKDNCRYFPGLELTIRCVSFPIGNSFLESTPKRRALNNFICVCLLLYMCAFKPFKSFANTLLYISYVFNAQCMIILLMFCESNIDTVWYAVIFDLLICIALAEFVITVLYYLYKDHLHKIEQLKKFITAMTNIILKYYHRTFKTNTTHPPSMIPLRNFELLQEELLLVDPSQ